VQRTGADQFDLYVFRSFARAFWKTLCHAAEEVGYEVR
jgi:heterotetrameric sarcosine oxidase gamma subunit